MSLLLRLIISLLERRRLSPRFNRAAGGFRFRRGFQTWSPRFAAHFRASASARLLDTASRRPRRQRVHVSGGSRLRARGAAVISGRGFEFYAPRRRLIRFDRTAASRRHRRSGEIGDHVWGGASPRGLSRASASSRAARVSPRAVALALRSRASPALSPARSLSRDRRGFPAHPPLSRPLPRSPPVPRRR